jgi:hypothetical protein
MTFVIDSDNNITALASRDASSAQGESFHTKEELALLSAKWPNGRLVEVWNSIPGLAPAKKFKDQNAAIAKVWKALQGLGDETPAPATTKATAARKPATKGKQAAQPKPTRAANAKVTAPAKPAVKASRKTASKPATKVAKGASSARSGSKKAVVIGLLKRKGGATLTQIMAATEWQAHSVRGFISGALGKNMGLTINSAKRQDGERVYSIG